MTDFLIIGNKNAVIYKCAFPRIMSGDMSLGLTRPGRFLTPDGTVTDKLQGLTRWYTNMSNDGAYVPVEPVSEYSPDKYPEYDNYTAIEVGKLADIPKDYTGVMGVPVTYLDRPNPDYEILGIGCGNSWKNYPDTLLALGFDPTVKYGGGLGTPVLHGKGKYARVFVQYRPKSR